MMDAVDGDGARGQRKKQDITHSETAPPASSARNACANHNAVMSAGLREPPVKHRCQTWACLGRGPPCHLWVLIGIFSAAIMTRSIDSRGGGRGFALASVRPSLARELTRSPAPAFASHFWDSAWT